MSMFARRIAAIARSLPVWSPVCIRRGLAATFSLAAAAVAIEKSSVSAADTKTEPMRLPTHVASAMQQLEQLFGDRFEADDDSHGQRFDFHA